MNAAASFADATTGQSEGQRAGIRRAKRAFERCHSRDLAALPPFSAIRGRRGTSVATPIRRALRGQAAGAPVLDHDVSGAGWQIFGRAMQSITTMMPVWQCGHVRNDWPVNASNRSR